ncbi:MAG TPA: hypothetical protein VNV88_06115, partial [Candidatus Solibacter sp.]|nr:hypothetical protein [Candidatus Solibacter sp.]
WPMLCTLLDFSRWWASVKHTDAINEGTLSATVLLDYVRFQAAITPGRQLPTTAASESSIASR